MLPLKKIYIDSRHCTSDSKGSSEFRIYLPMHIARAPNKPFFVTDITIPVSWYSVEAGRHDTIYFCINGLVNSASKCFLLEGKLLHHDTCRCYVRCYACALPV